MDTTVLNKNELLEHLQIIFKQTPIVKLEYEPMGPDNKKMWIAKNPKILDHQGRILIDLPNGLASAISKTKKEADKDIYVKIFRYLKEKK